MRLIESFAVCLFVVMIYETTQKLLIEYLDITTSLPAFFCGMAYLSYLNYKDKE